MRALRAIPRYTPPLQSILPLPPLPAKRITPQPADRRQQSAPHQSTWRRIVPRAPSFPLPPLTAHPRSSGWAKPESWRRATPPGQQERSRGHQRFPLSSPFLFCNQSSAFYPVWDVARASLQGRSAGPGPQVAPGAGVHALALSAAASGGPPLPGLDTPPEASGGRAPAGRGRTPALPGEVCKHSWFQSPGTAGSEATRATPRGGEGRKGPAGGGGSRAPSSSQGPETTPPPRPKRWTPPRPYIQPGARPRTPQSLPGSSGKQAPPTLQEGHTRPPGLSRERGGCRFGRRSKAKTARRRFPRRIRFNWLSKDRL